MTISAIGSPQEFPQDKEKNTDVTAQEEKAKPSIYDVIDDFKVDEKESAALGLNRTYDLNKAEDFAAFEKDSGEEFISLRLKEVKVKKQIIANNKSHVEKLLQDKQKLAESLMNKLRSVENYLNKYVKDAGISIKSYEEDIASLFDATEENLLLEHKSLEPGKAKEYSLAKVKVEMTSGIDDQYRSQNTCSKIEINLNGYGKIIVTPFGVTFTDNNGNSEEICVTQQDTSTIPEEQPSPSILDQFDNRPPEDVFK